ncbi:hypothetical protein ACQHIH_16150 [Xanthomonas sontii]|uniref:hypothetical protein n=1 Tax=Xanthomonas sontii TaxID=2650745 RepID=UPI003F863C81
MTAPVANDQKDMGAMSKDLQNSAKDLQWLDVGRVKSVQVRRMQTTTKTWDCIRIFVADCWYSADLVCDRDIRTARRLADNHGAYFGWDDANADRVKKVLGEEA